MNCRQVLQHLYEVIDKEASELDTKEVEQHLKMCRHCMARYEFARTFKAVVKEKGANKEDVTEVKANILSRLDAIDAEEEGGDDSHSPFKWSIVAMATAAVVILCIIAAVSITTLNNSQTAEKKADDNQIVANQQTTQNDFAKFIAARHEHEIIPETEKNHTDPLEYLFEQTGIRLNHSPDFPVENIRSVSVDTIMGIQFGCIELADKHNQLVTLFVTTSDRYDLPKHPVAIVDGREMVVHQCKECTLVGMEKQDLIYMVVADPECTPTELAQMASYF